MKTAQVMLKGQRRQCSIEVLVVLSNAILQHLGSITQTMIIHPNYSCDIVASLCYHAWTYKVTAAL